MLYIQVWHFVRHDEPSKKLTAKYENKTNGHVSFALTLFLISWI